jgi:hypothetical protein
MPWAGSSELLRSSAEVEGMIAAMQSGLAESDKPKRKRRWFQFSVRCRNGQSVSTRRWELRPRDEGYLRSGFGAPSSGRLGMDLSGGLRPATEWSERCSRPGVPSLL